MLLGHVVQRTRGRLSNMDRTKLFCIGFIVVIWILALSIESTNRTIWLAICNTIFWGYLAITHSDDT